MSEMDGIVPNPGDVAEEKPKLIHTSETFMYNGHSSSLNLSYQIVLQDHNYGAPLPVHDTDSSASLIQCKPESTEALSPSTTHSSHINQHKSGIKTLLPRSSNTSPQQGKGLKTNGINSPLNKRQRTTSGNSNGLNQAPSSPVLHKGSCQNYDASKTHIPTPPLLSKTLSFVGDLNSHLYASFSNDKIVIKEEEKVNSVSNGSGYPGIINNWLRNSGERVKPQSELQANYNEDSNESFSSLHMTADSDHEGEETETAPECEGEDDDHQEESVTRCICKYGHDDGYMICCDRCFVWQHVECMNLDRNNIPDEYMCELCQPRRVDRARARAVQYRKRQDFRLSTPPPNGDDRKDRSKERSKEAFVDVEKTPKKLNRSNSNGPKYSRSAMKNTATRSEGPRTGKRGGHQRWKRKGDKMDDGDNKDRVPRKRKIFRAKSSETLDVGSTSTTESSPSNKSSQASELLLQWIDHYEEAVTNHYSPELRARVTAIKPNGLCNDVKIMFPDTPSYRLASKAGGYKTLVASSPINAGMPIIKCRGKYMLASQLRPYKSGDIGNGGTGLRPTPHIIFHQLPTGTGDNCNPNSTIDMCVDGRSYGNEARFVWQSCQPNAEVKHIVEKGSVHLYLVAKTAILDSEEITIAHEIKNPLPCPYEGCPHMNNKDIGRTGLTSTSPSTPAPGELERKRRRRRTNSTTGEPLAVIHSVTTSEHSPVSSSSVATVTPATPLVPIRRQQRTPSKLTGSGMEGDEHNEVGSFHSLDDSDYLQNVTDHDVSTHEKKKLSREERKMEAIMKAFERLEKAEQRRQEALARMAHRKDNRDHKDSLCKDEDSAIMEREQNHSPPPQLSSSIQMDEKKDSVSLEHKTRTLRRGKRGGRLRRSSSGAGNVAGSRSRIRALSGEVHSGHSATEEESEHGGSSSSPGQGHSGPNADDSSDLLVAAFKCPKTKKVVFNNWSLDNNDLIGNKSDLSDYVCGSNPLSISVPVCYMRNPNPRSPTRPIRTTHLRPSTLVSLKTTSRSGSPDPQADSGQSNDENLWTAPLPGGAGGSAKKRWLRQAISEETETEPANGSNANANSVDTLDHVTPLKKRRLARASLSSETSFTPPSTPTPTQIPGQHDSVAADTLAIVPLVNSDKEESTIESLTTDNFQATPPECEDGEMELKKIAESNESIPSRSPEHQNQDYDCNQGFNGFIPEPKSSICVGVKVIDDVLFDSRPFLPASTTSISHYGENPLSTKPIWEFRAPDAQFMRSKNSETSDSICDPPENSPTEKLPKPVKRKLSILEYRQRKQNLTSDCLDSSRPESSLLDTASQLIHEKATEDICSTDLISLKEGGMLIATAKTCQSNSANEDSSTEPSSD